MCSVISMKTEKIGYIIISVFMCILGIVLIVVPDFSLNLFGVLCGAALIGFGIIRPVGYFSKDLYRLAFQYDLAFELLIIALGVIKRFHPTGLIHFMSITLGISFWQTVCLKYKLQSLQKNSEYTSGG